RQRSLGRRLAPTGHADLGEDAPQSGLPCDPPDGQRAPSPLETCAHEGVMPPLATWETQAVSLAAPMSLEEAAAVTHPVDAVEAGDAVKAGNAEPGEAVREERCDKQDSDKACLRQIRHLLPRLEADVL